jgi:hypothetical protein
VLRGDTKLLAPEETPEEVIREREQRAAALAAVQGKLRGGDAGERALYCMQHERIYGLHS